MRFILGLHISCNELYKSITLEDAMHTSSLRKVGGSVMLTIPPALLEILHLQTGGAVNLAIESGRLVIEPAERKRYSLKELLAQCDASAPLSLEDKEWTGSQPIGRELI
jgi:antitoxin ChpS